MDLAAFFDPVNPDLQPDALRGEWGRDSHIYWTQFPEWQAADILLLACGDARGGGRTQDGAAATAIRQQLYQLSKPGNTPFRVADLGTLKPRETPEGTYEALAYVLQQCLAANKTVLLFGGSQDLTIGQAMAYQDLGKKIEWVQIDSRLDLGKPEEPISHHTYAQAILQDLREHVTHLAMMGYQRYLVEQTELDWMREQHHEALRYGALVDQIEEAEPVLRLADMVSFDLGAIRMSESPGNPHPSPGGFTVMEACRLARYAGLGYGVSSFHVSEYVPERDVQAQSAMLSAMLLWYFVDGFYNRWDDRPQPDRRNLRRYSVQLHASVEAIDFYCHPGTERWWMAIPAEDASPHSPDGSTLVPCSPRDYEFAQADDIPERWWLRYHKQNGSA